MSYRSPLLQEFAVPIPICPIDADLDSMLSLFQHLNCKMLAVSQVKMAWGTISAENLLSLMAKNFWLEEATATNPHYSLGQRQPLTPQFQLELKALIEPTIVCRGEMEIDKFLSGFSGDDWLRQAKVCLIIDRQGTLQGKLDRGKVIEYLVGKSTPPLEKINPLTVDSIEQIELPVKPESLSALPNMANESVLTTVSHELKSPLTGILGLSRLLEGQAIGSLNQRQQRYVELIYRSSKKMMGVVDSLLQLNVLIGEKSRGTELINLELLCRQLYQEAIDKLGGTKDITPEQRNWARKIDRERLKIELGSEIAVANKPLLSAVLSHLLQSSLAIGTALKPPKIQIKSRGGVTAITISQPKAMPEVNLGLNWIVAECLSQALPGRVSYTSNAHSCRFVLLLAKNKAQSPTSLLAVATNPQPGDITTNNTLTILCLYPELEELDPLAERSDNSHFDLKRWSNKYEEQAHHQHRILEADSLEQAHNLARIWQLNAVVLNGYQIARPDCYLRSLQKYGHLARLPLITLDAKTTAAANQISGLNVYPCLLPARQCGLEDLFQVIKIAIAT